MRRAVALILLVLLASRSAPAQSSDASVQELIAAIGRAAPDDRPPLVARLIDKGDSALEDVRKAAAEAADGSARAALERAAVWIQARALISDLRAGIESQLSFDGQYETLSRFGAGGVEALLAIVDDSATPLELRIAACHALADVGSPALLPALRRLRFDPLLPFVLDEQVGILLAIFGDRDSIAPGLRTYEKLARSNLLPVRLEGLEGLANLRYRIRDYKKAVEAYEAILKLVEQFVRRRRESGGPAEALEDAERALSLHYYNAACSNSLLGDTEKAKEYLRRAVERNPEHFENMEKDGDLRRLREDPGYGEFRKEIGKLYEDRDL